MFMLKISSPLCCGFLHMFFLVVFGIVSFLSRDKEISWVVCFEVTS